MQKVHFRSWRAEHKRTDVSHLIEYKYINKALNHFVIYPCSQTIYSETIVPDPDLEIRAEGGGAVSKKTFFGPSGLGLV